jgi:hypothetical protein
VSSNPSYSGGRDQEDHGSKQILSKILSPKNKTKNWCGQGLAKYDL